MTTQAEIDKMIAKTKAAMKELDTAAEALADAREVLRDAAALIDAMGDELAERGES